MMRRALLKAFVGLQKPGVVPVEESVQLAVLIAEVLEAAHRGSEISKRDRSFFPSKSKDQ